MNKKSLRSRQKRDGEQEGKDYFFIDEKAFEAMRANEEFLEHAEVFGNFYATGREIERVNPPDIDGLLTGRTTTYAPLTRTAFDENENEM